MVSDGQIKAKINSEQKTIAFIDSVSQNGDQNGEQLKEKEYFEVIEELEA